MKNIRLKFYSDPGHGWLAVKRRVLHDYNVADKISDYSYQKGSTVYLEYTRDASILITAMQNSGVNISYDERHMDRRHPIRSYEYFKN